jgi:hypothetical protein
MPLSQSALQAVLSSATEKVFLECLTISHPDISTIRLVNDTQDLSRTSGTFTRFPFSVSAATQVQDRPPSINITGDAVDQRIVQGLRELAGKRERAQITYEVVLADTPDTIEFGPVKFEFDSMTADSATQVTVKASFLKGALNDAFPSGQFAPSNVSS